MVEEPRATTVIGERYRLERVLGEGAMGIVWLATHLSLTTQVALKLLHPKVLKHAQAGQRFHREAVMAARIKSAHVVKVLDHGTHGDWPYMVMDLLDGEELRSRLTRLTSLGLEETMRLIAHVSRALSHAHALGLVHRDIKPDNIFVCPGEDGGPEVFKVIDFGVVKVSDDAGLTRVDPTATGTLVGTPYYASPEQATGAKNVGPASDLWSLGVVAFECLTGHRPFESPSLGGLLVAIATATAPPPSRLRPELGPAIDRWMAQALARQPEDRFLDAKHMSLAFEAACQEGAAKLQTARMKPPGPPADGAALTSSPSESDAPSTSGTLALPQAPAPAAGPAGAPQSERFDDAPSLPLRSPPFRSFFFFLLLAGGLSGGAFYLLRRQAPEPTADDAPSPSANALAQSSALTVASASAAPLMASASSEPSAQTTPVASASAAPAGKRKRKRRRAATPPSRRPAKPSPSSAPPNVRPSAAPAKSTRWSHRTEL